MNAEQAKFLVDFCAKLWEGEFPATCKVIAAVPDARRNYKPDDKSRSAWDLAVHLATADIWFLDSILQGAFAYDPEAEKKASSRFSKVSDVVEMYKKEVPKKLQALQAMPAEDLTREVDFFGIMNRPAVSYLGLANNHSIHHRGQLAAYLRAMGSKVPALYGASADESMQ